LRRHPAATGLGLLVVIAAIVAGVLWYLQARHYESTDDAFIDGRPVYVNLQVPGVIEQVPVTDNQIVKPGDLLVSIDKRDYQAAVDSADAQIEQASAVAANVNAQIYEQTANIEQVRRQATEAQAALDFSREENTRCQTLLSKGAGTEQRAQQSESDLQSKQAAVWGASRLAETSGCGN
jgi:membrane fusion protein (multidrug efflux system)